MKKIFADLNLADLIHLLIVFANVPAWKERKLVVYTKMYKTIVLHRDVCMLALANMKAEGKCHECLVLVAISKRCKAETQDVKAAILVFQNNETAAMFVNQTNPVRVELFLSFQ